MAIAATSAKNGSIWSRLNQYTDLMLAGAVCAIVGMMIVPLPKWLIDILFITNLSLSLVILMAALYAPRSALQFSVFPSLLLLTTLFRLGLDISATRLILLEANAGEVVKAFGDFVVGGNFVVGVVVFLILIVVNFVVITNGAGRVAEVAARFTLDAMPGKQMAIDAELNAGAISDEQARTRRQTVQQEADFYGAMDGASKFVKGDAMAAIIIMVINIVGGFVIGVVQLKMQLGVALSTYTILTVGEGLVSQIPALLISTATGMIVTRAASAPGQQPGPRHQRPVVQQSARTGHRGCPDADDGADPGRAQARLHPHRRRAARRRVRAAQKRRRPSGIRRRGRRRCARRSGRARQPDPIAARRPDQRRDRLRPDRAGRRRERRQSAQPRDPDPPSDRARSGHHRADHSHPRRPATASRYLRRPLARRRSRARRSARQPHDGDESRDRRRVHRRTGRPARHRARVRATGALDRARDARAR